MPSQCGQCSAPIAADDGTATHGLTCPHLKGTEITRRHDEVQLAIETHARRASVQSLRHQRTHRDDPSSISRKAVDTTLFFADGQVDIDYTIVHPTAASHVRTAASSEPLATAQQAKKRKLQHHSSATTDSSAPASYTQMDEADAINQQQGDECTRVIAFVAETYGGLHEDAREVIRDISIAAQHHLVTFTRSEIVSGLHASVAVAIQRGNARAILASLSAAAAPSARYRHQEVSDVRFSASTPVSLLCPSLPGPHLLPRRSLATHVNPLAYRLFTDGASRGNGTDSCMSSCGVVLFPPFASHDKSGKSVVDVSREDIMDCRSFVIGPARTNNQAEYEAVIAGLLCAAFLRLDHIHIFADSQVVVDQVNGHSNCLNLHLKQLLNIVEDLKRCFVSFGITHIKRKHNTLADEYANRAFGGAEFEGLSPLSPISRTHIDQHTVREMLDNLPQGATPESLGILIYMEFDKRGLKLSADPPLEPDAPRHAD